MKTADLPRKSLEALRILAGEPSPSPPQSDRIVAVVDDRDGTIINVVRVVTV